MQNAVAVFGEALIDLIADEQGRWQAEVGGSPFNFARGIQAQGCQSLYLNPISKDAFGEQIRGLAVKEGVRMPFNNRSVMPTSLALVNVDRNGLPEYSFYRSGVADLDITAQQLLASLVSDTQLFHTGSMALVPDMEPVLTPFLQRLRRQNVIVSMDLNMRARACADRAAYIETAQRLAQFADVLKVSDEDLRFFGLQPPFTDVVPLFKGPNGTPVIVLTQGADGASVILPPAIKAKNAEHLEVSVAAVKLEHMADTVGAGDIFYAAFIAQCLKRDLLRESGPQALWHQVLHYAAVAASINIEHQGCYPPSESEVQRRLAALLPDSESV